MVRKIFLLLALAYRLQCVLCNYHWNHWQVQRPAYFGAKVINGETDTEWCYRYAVALYATYPKLSYKCTGTIIGPRTVLTAAHCLYNKRLGIELHATQLYGIVGSEDRTKGRRINFVESFPHPGYIKGRHDIAILKTANNIITDDNVTQACIASRRTKMDQYRFATAMGWGRTTNHIIPEEQRIKHLQYVELELSNRAYCEMRFPSVTNMHLCGEGYGKSTCFGDSGGPLSHINRENGRKDVVIGVTSFGSTDCASKWMQPTVFTRVSIYYDWIIAYAGEDRNNICIDNTYTRKPQVSSRVIGGRNAHNGEFTYVAALYFDDKFMCTGSIIGSRTILAAAHCFFDGEKVITDPHLFHAVVGNVDRRKGRRIDLVKILPHPSFSRNAKRQVMNDIVVLKTAAVITDDHATKVCLADPSTDLNQYNHSTIMGWGFTTGDFNDDSPPTHPNIMQYAKMDILNQSACIERYSGDVGDKHMCVVDIKKGPCYGDSGGPLSFVDDKSGHILLGVTSYSKAACNSADFPTVYARVSAYYDWIVKTAGKDGETICRK